MPEFTFKRKSDGSIDVPAAVKELEALLQNFAATEKKENETIASAVEKVFEEFPNENLQLPALATFAATKIGYTPDNYLELTEKIKTFVRNQSSKYKIERGRAGGVRRVA